MKIGRRIAGSTVLMLMNPMAVFNSLSQHSKRRLFSIEKNLNVNALQLGDMEPIITQDVKNLLQREVVARKDIKWSVSLKAIMYKLVAPDVVTDPPAVFNTDMVWGLIGSSYIRG